MSIKNIRYSVKIVLLNDKNEILLLKRDDEKIRTKDDKYNGSFWELIGGKIEQDETIIETAKRELYRETGLTENDVEFIKEIWFGTVYLLMNNKTTHIHQRFILARAKKNDVTMKNLPNEDLPFMKSLKWFSVSEIRKSHEIIYPVTLPNHLEKIINGDIPDNPKEIDLKKQPNINLQNN